MSHRFIALALSALLLFSTSGCATMFGGMSQMVVVRSQPAGGTVKYRGRNVSDGQSVVVDKDFQTPEFHVDAVPIPMQYEPNPWLVADGVLLFFFIVPGVVAFGVDFGTGAWRNLRGTQVVHVPDPQH